MDREGLRVVPEAALVAEQEGGQPAGQGGGQPAGQGGGQPAGQGAQTGTVPGDHVRSTSGRGTFRALRSRPFRLYFAGQVASASGTFVQQTAIGWLVLRRPPSRS